MAQKRGFIFTNYSQLINVKQKTNQNGYTCLIIYKSNCVGLVPGKVRDERLKAGVLSWKPV